MEQNRAVVSVHLQGGLISWMCVLKWPVNAAHTVQCLKTTAPGALQTCTAVSNTLPTQKGD